MATLLHRHEFLIFYRRFTTGAFSLSLLMNQLAPDLRCMGRAGIASSLLGIADFLSFSGRSAVETAFACAQNPKSALHPKHLISDHT